MPEIRPYQRILALVDFDSSDRRTAEKALLLGRLSHAKLSFLHLAEPEGFMDGGYPASSSRNTAHQVETSSRRRLAFLAAQIGAGEAECHAAYGPWRQTLLDHIKHFQPDLIVANGNRAYPQGMCDVLILPPPTKSGGRRMLKLLGSLLSSPAKLLGI